MRVTEKMKKLLSILLCLLMLVQSVPVTVFAAAEDGLCEHHTAHSAEVCGYREAVQEVPCGCESVDENGAVVHTDGCGYVASVSGSACTYRCHICHVQELVDALPGEVTAENAEAVAAQLTAIDNEKASLSDEELVQVDFAKYTAAAEGLGSVYNVVPIPETTTYTVTVNSTEHGSVVPDVTEVTVGTTVTLTVTADSDYELEALKYNDGTTDTLITATDGVYSFAMPAANVTVTATFKAVEATPTTYTVTIAESIENGTVAADVTEASEGETVTLTVTANEGFVLDALTVTAENATAPTPVEAEGKYTFTMPAANVTVTATFKEVASGIQAGYYLVGTLNGENKLSVDQDSSDRLLKEDTNVEGQYCLEYTFAAGDKLKIAYFDGQEITEWYKDDAFYSIAEAKAGKCILLFRPEGNDIWSFTYFTVTPVYSVTVNTVENGTVTADKAVATADETVTLTVTPAEGYALWKLAVRTGSGHEVTVQDNTFTMPGQSVTVEAIFRTTAKRTVYFDNRQAQWGNVNIFFWSADNSAMTTWPGEAMTAVGGNIYSYEIPADAETVIFNNGAVQTSDQTLDDENCCLGTVEHSVWYTYPCSHTFSDGECTACGVVCDHNFDSTGKCATCGIQAVAKIGETYYLTLAQAAAEVTEGDTINVLTDVTIGADETLTFAAFATLDVAEGKTVTCNGAVKIGEAEGIIFENTLYYHGGTADETWDISPTDPPTYWDAGEGYAIFQPAVGEETAVLTLHNAIVEELDLVGDEGGAIEFYAPLTIRFSGSNRLTAEGYDRSALFCINGDTVMEGIGQDAQLSLQGGGDSHAAIYGSIFDGDLTLLSGTVTICSGDGGNSCSGASITGTLTVASGAVLNVMGGDSPYGISVGLGAKTIAAEGTINGLVGMLDESGSGCYLVYGNTVLEHDLNTVLEMDGEYSYKYPFSVLAGTSLTVNSGVTLDLSKLELADIDFTGTVINNGTILLPADFALDNAPKSGNIRIGEKSYTWDSENNKWICAEGSHITELEENKATCAKAAICDLCGASYGAVDKTNHDTENAEYDNGFCTVCDAYEPAELVDGVYQIGNAGNLYWFADKVTNENAAYGSADAILTCDIRVNEGTMTEASTGARVWTPIGKHGFGVNIPYTGTFEGNGKTVSGLYFNDTSANFSVGLFSLVGEGGKVQNVGIADSYLCGSQSIGAVAGSNYGAVTGCYNTGIISGSGNSVGGVVGYNYGTATNCYNTGTVSGESSVGGVVGSNSGTLTDCHNTGTVSGESDVGGVVGRSIGGVYYNGIVTDCHNTGTVSGKDTVGGVVGSNDGTATNCTNSGTVSGTSDVGGVVGLGNASNCYNTGTVSGTTYVGGVAGDCIGEAILVGCYNSGTVSGTTNVGGVVGFTNATVTNCYFDSTVYTGDAIGTNEGTATNVEGKSTEQFASGEVAYLLSQGENGDIWGQTIGTDPTPIFSDAKVYYGYTSCGDTEAGYTNEEATEEKPAHTQQPAYTDNHDGTHSAVYPCCGTTIQSEEHNFENDAHQCVCGVFETFTVYWTMAGSLMQSTSTYGQDFTQTFTVPENTHLRILEVNNKEDGTQVKYSFENDTLTIAAEDLPAADIDILCEHYVEVKFDANGGKIIPEEGFPLEGDTGFAEDGSYWVQEIYVGGNTYLSHYVNIIYTGYTLIDWRDATGQIYPMSEANGAKFVSATEDVTVYAQWQANQYIVTWNVDGETSTTQQTYDAALILPESEPTKTGFDFVGWYTAAEGGEKVDGATVFQNANNDTIYYARFCNHSSSQHTAATPNEDGKTHSFTCTVCSKTSAENHTGGTATCTEQAKCDLCGASYGDFADHSMDYVADEEANTITYRCGTCDTQTVTFTLVIPTGAVYGSSAMAVPHYDCSDKTYNGDSPVITLDGKEQKNFVPNAGTYAVTMTWGGQTVSGEYTIAKAEVSITAAPTPNTLTYIGESQYLISAGEAVGGTMLYSSTEEGEYTTSIPQGTNAGDYTVWYYVQGDANHNDSAKASVDVSIAKAPLTVTADAKIKSYGDENPPLTYTAEGLLGGDTLSGALTGALSREEGENVGSYAITLGTLSADNYTISFVGADFTIQAKEVSDPTVTLEQDSYAYDGTAKEPEVTSIIVDGVKLTEDVDYRVLSYERNIYVGEAEVVIHFMGNYRGSLSRFFQITKAPLTVTADSKTMTTGQELPTFTYTITGFVGGESEDVLTAKPTVVCVADGKTAGTYDITVSGAAADNYEITHVNGTLTVADHQHAWTYTAKDDTITATCNAEGCPDAEQSITISAVGKTYDGTPVTATLTGSIDGVATPEITYTGNTNAGTHTASITVGEVTASVEFTIEKATVTVTADAKSKPYGTDNPTLTYTSEGLLGDDALTGALETTATKTSSVGEYDITVGSLANSNYTIDFVGAKLTITKAALTITADSYESVRYGSAAPAFAANYSGFVNGETEAVLGGELVFSCEYDTANAAKRKPGDYPIVPSGLTSNNYEISYVDGNLEVISANLVIVIDDKTVTYGDAAPEYTYHYEGFVYGEDISVMDEPGTVSCAYVPGNAVGTMEIKSDNYGSDDCYFVVNQHRATLTIEKAPLTITAEDNSITYGDAPAANGVTGTGFVNGESFDDLSGELTYSYNYEQFGNVGTYKITPVGLTSDNYEITFADGTLTVNAKAITVTADAVSKTYGDIDPTLTYTAQGLVNGDELTGELKRVAGENVGSYAIEQNTLTAGNNYSITYTGANLTINAKAITEADVELNGSLTYTGEEQTQPITVTEGITYEVTGNKATNVGSYVLTIQGTGNYTGEVKLNWSIKEAAAVVGKAPTAKELTYTGTAQALVNAGTTADGKLVYSLSENGEFTESIPTGTNAGEYTVWYYVQGDDNHSDTAKASVKVTIAKADPVIGTVGCDMALFDSTAASAVELTRTDMSVEGTLVLTDSELTAGEGTYNWKFTPKDTNNYNTITGTVVLNVTADVLEKIEASGTLEKDSYSYGDTFSIDGLTVTATYTTGATKDVTELVSFDNTLAVGQTSVKLTYQGKTCTVTGFNVAKKQLIISGMAWDIPENAVYSGTAYNATLTGNLPEGVTVTKTGDTATNAGDYTAKAVFSLAEGYSADNYEIVNGEDLTADWTIAKKNIVGAQITLGTALTYNGKQQTQTVTKVEIDGLTVTYTVSGNTGTDAKGYTLTVTGNGNFEGTETKEWSIAKKNISGATITLGDSLTYNGNERTQEVTDVKIGELTVTYDVTANKQTNAGKYTLTVTGNGNFEGSATADWSIAKAKLTITANNNSITYGDIPAANGVTGTGFVSSESIEDLSGELTYSYNYEQFGNVGTYKITPSGVTSNNYEITFADGTLTVNAKAITVTADAVSKTYGDADPKLTYKVEGLVNGDELTGELKRVAGENVGDYAIEQNTLTAGNNYRLAYTGAKLTIKAKAITAADVKLNGSLTYNGKEQTQAITVTEGITYEVTGNKATNVGTYELTVKGTGNYTGSVTLDWTITKAKLTITADSKVIYIGEKLPTLTYTVSGLVDGDKLTKEPALTTNADADQAGSYTITAANADAGMNYAITYVGGTLTIMDKNTEVETKVETAALTEVPDGLKNTKFNTVEAIKQELTSRIVATSTGFVKENMAHYDVTLQFSLDGGETWILATEENFPTEGIIVTLPYPYGTNAAGYDFVVSHMFTVTSQRLGTTAGDVELPSVTETASGIRVTLKGLSPVTLAWRATEFDVKIAGTTNGTVSTNVSKATSGTEITVTVTPKYGYKMATLTVKDASGKSYAVSTDNSGKYYFTMPSADVTVTATFSKISSSTADTTNPKTGDDFQLMLWSSILSTSAIFLLAALADQKRKLIK